MYNIKSYYRLCLLNWFKGFKRTDKIDNNTVEMKNYIKMNNKSTRIKVAKGVSKCTSGYYEVRKMVDGVRTSAKFTNKAKAIKFYKSI